MPDIISTLLAFVLAIAILIAVHEYGHFSIARLFNIKVLKFSIGFGPTLFKYHGKRDRTEFVLATIPLGGYVKMLDENEAEVDTNEKHRAFNNQTVYKRFAVVAAGPLVNFIFAIFAFFLMYIIGIQGIKPKLDNLEEDSIAWQSGFRNGDVIKSVNGVVTPTWGSMHEAIVPFFVNRENVSIRLENNQYISLKLENVADNIELKHFNETLGFKVHVPKIEAVIGGIVKDSPADRANLKVSDKIIKLDEKVISSWQDLVEYVQDKPNKHLIVQIKRAENIFSIDIQTSMVERNGKNIGILGIHRKQSKDFKQSFFVMNQYAMLPAFIKAIEKTWDMSLLTLNMMKKMILGQASIENISGPITIAEVAGHSYRQGVEYFLRFLAIVSLSLGIINLLPIPVLDGGHLLFYLYEMIVGKPLSKISQDFLFKIGVIILILLMSIAFFNDISRLLLLK